MLGPGHHSQLRRLRWSRRLGSDYRLQPQRDLSEIDPFALFGEPRETDNPFERPFEQRPQERLMVAVHAVGFREGQPDDVDSVHRFAEHPEDWGIRVFAAADQVTASMPGLTVEPLEHSGAGEVHIHWGGGHETRSVFYDLEWITQWAPQHLPPAKVPEAIAVAAAHAAGAHMIVTADRSLLRVRDELPLREANLLTPRETLVVLGSWARLTGRAGDFAHWRPSGWIAYWAFARALTPNGWPAFGAWVYGERQIPNARELGQLAQSVFTRLGFLVRALDEMFVLWQRNVSNETQDLLAARFDEVLMRVWAIESSLARMVGLSLGARPASPLQWSLTDRTFRRQLRAHHGAEALLEATRPHLARVRASQLLRHYAVHRESLSMVRMLDNHGEPESARLRLPAQVADAVHHALVSAGESPAGWGLGPRIEAHTVHRSSDLGGGLREERDEWDSGGCFLDPMMFAARLVAAVAGLADTVFGALDPAADPALPAHLRDRVLHARRDDWASAERALHLLLTTPVSGLTPWVGPHAKEPET